MSGREELELLSSRFFDGDLTAQENARLEAALAADPELRELHADLMRAHQGVAMLASAHPLPQDFTRRILAALDQDTAAQAGTGPGAVIHQLPKRHWTTLIAAAAAVVLAIGLVFGASYLSENPPTVAPPVAKGGEKPVIGPEVVQDTRPRAEVVALSSGAMRLTDGAGATSQQTSVTGQVILPATVQAPADAHVLVRVGGGTAIVPPGATVRLSDVDADGVPNLESVDGDLYLESGDKQVSTRVNNVRLSLRRGGMTLRRTENGVVAEPSFGFASIGSSQVSFRQSALINGDTFEVSPCPNPVLDDWAVEGRLDAIKLQLRDVLGAEYPKFEQTLGKSLESMLRGILANPSEAATNSRMLHFFVKHGWLDDRPESERQAMRNIADIIGQGTTDADVPVPVRQLFAQLEEELKKNPDAIRDFARMMREALERRGDHHRKRGG
ncbi:MAG: hypothetical protein IPP14_08235 [Planctomycetes bacterium]|nr:hypothetical protein [Planctomycetota bacterium]